MTNLFHGYPAEKYSLAAYELLNYVTITTFSGFRGELDLWYRSYDTLHSSSQFLDDQRFVERLSFFGQPWHYNPEEAGRDRGLESELQAAHLTARAPLLAVITADTMLPRVTREKGASERAFVNIALEVKWGRVLGILGGLVFGQALATAAAIFWCRNIIYRDHDSYLSVARLMKQAMEHTKGRSVDTGPELAACMKKEGVWMRYGPRRIKDDEYEVTLWEDVENEFLDRTYR
ncbi:hypothetical protein DL770_009637 [Monosporascus sp. CRB-9-2]|nr:hypothetical protein DL770_009637 [Monosporascus sp. CRB-9-2]